MTTIDDIIEHQRVSKRLQAHPVIGPILKAVHRIESSAMAEEQAGCQFHDRAAARHATVNTQAHAELRRLLLELEARL